VSATSSPFSVDDVWLDQALRRFASTRDGPLRLEIAERASPIAMRCARRYSDRGEPMDDLRQVAQIGLLKAVDRFDPEFGVPFGAFATPTVIGELRRYFRDHTWRVHVPRSVQELRSAVTRSEEELGGELGRTPLLGEIADQLHVEPSAVIEAIEARNAYRPTSLDVGRVLDSVATDPGFGDVLDREVLGEAMTHLSARQRRIVYLRFFREMSQSEIAELVGISQAHVGRLIELSLAELRRHLNVDDITSTDDGND
jgi:RNA polymerase sigma-B factor